MIPSLCFFDIKNLKREKPEDESAADKAKTVQKITV